MLTDFRQIIDGARAHQVNGTLFLKKTANKIFLPALVAVAIGFACPSVSLAVQATLLEDAYTKSATASKFGTVATVVVNTTSTGLLQFDISTLPPGVTADNVKGATLTLFVRGTVKTSGTIKLTRVMNSWNESSVTGSTFPGLGTTEVTGITVGPADSNQFIGIDITTLVQDWVNGAANNGVALVY